MGYVFKEKITYSQYEKFIRNYPYLSYMQENLWSKTKEYKNYLIVGILDGQELCAVAQIIIQKNRGSNKLFIPNGYLLDFTNNDLVSFMTINIKALAHKYHAYVVDIYPYITTTNTNYQIIHNNLLQNNYIWTNEYLDRTKNVLISLMNGKKKISKKELTKKYDKKDFYLKRGIEFEISDSLEDIKRLNNLTDKEYIDNNLIGNLMLNFKDRIKLLFAKIDLVFYLNFLKNNDSSLKEINKVEELIANIGDEMDIGCALIILPYNKKQNICEYLYHTEKESFDNLEITHGLLYEIIKEAHHYGCQYIKISNIDLNEKYYIDNYQANPIEFIGHYSLVINKLNYFLNKEIKKRR